MDSTMAVAQRITVAEYLELPVQRGCNLVDGEVVVNEPRALHQRVMVDLIVALTLWSLARSGRGEVTAPLDVKLGEHDCFAPDVLWYREGRAPGRSLVRPQPLPDIAVEIRSPSTWRHDIGAKKARYEQGLLPELWLVDTAADAVIIFRRSSPQGPSFDISLELVRGDVLTSPLLPGFELALDELFGPAAT